MGWDEGRYIGRNNADNLVSTAAVTSDANGSILERLEYVQTTGSTALTEIPSETNAKTWNATALAAIQSEVNDALVANSLDHFLFVADGGGGTYPTKVTTDSIIAYLMSKDATPTMATYNNTTDSLEAISDKLRMGEGSPQTFDTSITSAANVGAINVALITTNACLIKSIVISSSGATTSDLTSIAITGGASNAVTFIDAAAGAQANLDAEDKQVAWTGAVRLGATKYIVATLTGTGATAVDLRITVEYCAVSDGGYLA